MVRLNLRQYVFTGESQLPIYTQLIFNKVIAILFSFEKHRVDKIIPRDSCGNQPSHKTFSSLSGWKWIEVLDLFSTELSLLHSDFLHRCLLQDCVDMFIFDTNVVHYNKTITILKYNDSVIRLLSMDVSWSLCVCVCVLLQLRPELWWRSSAMCMSSSTRSLSSTVSALR